MAFPKFGKIICVIIAITFAGCVGRNGLYNLPTPTIVATTSPSPVLPTATLKFTETPQPTATPPVINRDTIGRLSAGRRLGDERINQFAWSSDGQHLLTSSVEGIRMIDARTFATRFQIDPARVGDLGVKYSSVRAVAFHPGGLQFVSSIDRNQDNVVLWDAQTEKVLRVFQGMRRFVSYLAFSPDGRHLAGGDWDGNVFIWEVETGKPLFPLPALGDKVTGLSFSSDGSRLLSGCLNGSIKVWDTETGQQLSSFDLSAKVYSAILHPDGKFIWVGDEQGALHHVSLDGQDLRTIQPFQSGLISLSFNPSGDLVAGLAADSSVQVWDALTGDGLFNVPGVAGANLDLSYDMGSQIAFRPDGMLIAAGGFQDGVRLWGLEQTSAQIPQPTPYQRSSYSSLPPGMYLTYIGNILENEQVVSIDKNVKQHFIEQWGAYGLNADGSVIEMGNINGMQIWDLKTNQTRDVAANGIISSNLKWVAIQCGKGNISDSYNGVGIYATEGKSTDCLIQPSQPEEEIKSWQFSPDSHWLSYIRYTYLPVDEPLKPNDPTPTPVPVPPTDGLYLVDTACFNQPDTCKTKQRGPFYDPGIQLDGSMAWFPDSQKIVFQGDPAVHPFYIFDIQTGVFTPIPTSGNYRQFGLLGMAVSPDSQWIAFTQIDENGAGYSVYLQPIQGGLAQLFLSRKEEHCMGFFIGYWFVKP